MSISNNTTERICKIYGFLEYLEKKDVKYVSSKELAKNIDSTADSVRKDISSLDIRSFGRKGYEVLSLKEQLGIKLNLVKPIKACIVGLGRIGTAILDYEEFSDDGIEIVAGFDTSVNKIERIHTSVDVYTISRLEDVVKQSNVELGIIAVPQVSAQNIADKLIKGGVNGIINFSGVKISVPENIILHNMDFTAAMRFVVARLKRK